VVWCVIGLGCAFIALTALAQPEDEQHLERLILYGLAGVAIWLLGSLVIVVIWTAMKRLRAAHRP
jgi:hypothetical protein